MPPLSSPSSFACSGSCAALHGGRGYEEMEEDGDGDDVNPFYLHLFVCCVAKSVLVGILQKAISQKRIFRMIGATFQLV